MLVWYILRTYNEGSFVSIISEDKVNNYFFTTDSCHILRFKLDKFRQAGEIQNPLYFYFHVFLV